MRTRLDLVSLFHGTGCELGVAAGAFSKAILGNPQVGRLYAIDRWSDHHGLQEHKAAAEVLAEAGAGRCVVLRASFHEVLPLFEDESLDFIYVDGYAHTGQEGGRTLWEWWPKLKPGGIMAGHDYCERYRPTMDAVDQFVLAQNLQFSVTCGGETYPSWWVLKPQVALPA
jgi:hypothetical protein